MSELQLTCASILQRRSEGPHLAAEMQQLQIDHYRPGMAIPQQRDAYTVHTLPGIDTAFILALCVVLDDTSFRPTYTGSYTQYGYPYGYYGGPYGYGGFGPYAGVGLGLGLALPLLLTAAWF
jgi:hypothetical protein